MARELKTFKRIVVKIGSALLVDRNDGLRRTWLESVARDISELVQSGSEVLVVSSGAIAMGRTVLNLPGRVLKLDENQACAAIGQIALARAWSESLSAHGLNAGQVLLTLGDTEERRRYLNARATINNLLKWNAVPIINENDTVATSEIRYGDNDRLAARVATMVGADLLILLSDVDGLYSAPPDTDADATFLPVVNRIDERIEAMAGDAGSALSRGGMVTKVEAAKIATRAGTAMVITSGKKQRPISALDNGAKATWFEPQDNPVTARKKWIAGQLENAGSIIVDEGAEAALRSGKSMLLAGVKRVDGKFQKGDTIAIKNHNGIEIGRGLVAYDAKDAERLAGCKSSEIESVLGFSSRAEIVHRDDMVLMDLLDASGDGENGKDS